MSEYIVPKRGLALKEIKCTDVAGVRTIATLKVSLSNGCGWISWSLYSTDETDMNHCEHIRNQRNQMLCGWKDHREVNGLEGHRAIRLCAPIRRKSTDCMSAVTELGVNSQGRYRGRDGSIAGDYAHKRSTIPTSVRRGITPSHTSYIYIYTAKKI